MKGNVGKSNLSGKLTGVAAVEVALQKICGNLGAQRERETDIKRHGEDLKTASVLKDTGTQMLIQEATCTKLFLYGTF